MPETTAMPKSSFVVLGLLSFCEMSGYDLKQLADRSVGYFYMSPARSQVYSELKRLAERGYATERRVEQDYRPDKRLYSITESGIAALREWLHSEATAGDAFKSHLLLKVFFGQHMDRRALIEEIGRYRKDNLDFIQTLNDMRSRCSGEPGTLFSYLTAGLGIAHSTANAAWAGEAIRLLESADADYTCSHAGTAAAGSD